MKNKSGFTLTELLTTIIILGILSVVAFASITNVLERSKNKVYMGDAKKLIAYSEYQMKLNKFKKPRNGECIIISLGYFNNQDFSVGPNGGKYSSNSSFVVIKNVDGELKYATSLIEELKKGGYKGIDLTEDNDIYKKGKENIKTWQEKNLIKVENIGLGTNYWNSKVIQVYSN